MKNIVFPDLLKCWMLIETKLQNNFSTFTTLWHQMNGSSAWLHPQQHIFAFLILFLHHLACKWGWSIVLSKGRDSHYYFKGACLMQDWCPSVLFLNFFPYATDWHLWPLQHISCHKMLFNSLTIKSASWEPWLLFNSVLFVMFSLFLSIFFFISVWDL